MANDDTEAEATESSIEVKRQQEAVNDNATACLCPQISYVDSCTGKSAGDRGKHNLMFFSRSAETVANPGVDQKQPGQRPDRQHARRPSAVRRGCPNEQNPSATRCAGNKTSYRASKASHTRTSKSCTKECEVLRLDYCTDSSATYSALYEELLRTEDSTNFIEAGEDGSDYEQEEVTLSDSTALFIDDDDDIEGKSDITTTSGDEESQITDSGPSDQKCLVCLKIGRDGSCECSNALKKSSLERTSEDCLVSDNDLLEGEQPEDIHNGDIIDESQARVESNKSCNTWSYGAEDLENTFSFSEESTRHHHQISKGNSNDVSPSTINKRTTLEKTDQYTIQKLILLEGTDQSPIQKLTPLEGTDQSLIQKFTPLEINDEPTLQRFIHLERIDQSTLQNRNPLEITEQSTLQKLIHLERTDKSTQQELVYFSGADAERADNCQIMSSARKDELPTEPNQTKKRLISKFLAKSTSEYLKVHCDNSNIQPSPHNLLEVARVGSPNENFISPSQGLSQDCSTLIDNAQVNANANVVIASTSSQKEHTAQRDNDYVSQIKTSSFADVGEIRPLTSGDVQGHIRASPFADVHGTESINGVAPFTFCYKRLELELTNFLLQNTPGPDKQSDALSQNNLSKKQNGSREKLVPSPEKISNAASESSNCKYTPMPHLTNDDDKNIDYLAKTLNNYDATYHKTDRKKLDTANFRVQEQHFTEIRTEKFESDSPGISILSFNSIKEVVESDMPSRRDHNDVYHGDKLISVYSLSRSPTPCPSANEQHSPDRLGDINDATNNGETGRGNARVISSSNELDSDETIVPDNDNSVCSSRHTAKLTEQEPPSCRLLTASPRRELTADSCKQVCSKENISNASKSPVLDLNRDSKCKVKLINSKLDHTSDINSKRDHTSDINSKRDHTSDINSKLDHTSDIHSKLDHTSDIHSKLDHTGDIHSKRDHTSDINSKLDHTSDINSKLDHTNDIHSKLDHTSDIHSKLDHTSNINSKANEGYNKVLTAPAATAGTKCVSKLYVPSQVTHEYLPFLDKLRKDTEKAAKRESIRQQNRINKLQRKQAENGKKSTVPSEDDYHGDAESLTSTPVCPIGHEVPPDWKPGAHGSHPLTKISASYTSSRKLRMQRRSIRRKIRTQNVLSQRTKLSDSCNLKVNTNLSNTDVNITAHQSLVEHLKLRSVNHLHESDNTDYDANQEEDTMEDHYWTRSSFENMRKYCEKMSDNKKTHQMAELCIIDHKPVPKLITSQVRLLKTLDELYSSPDDDAEGDTLTNNQSGFDINHQMSLFNYYSTRLKHLSMIDNVSNEKSDNLPMPMFRIRKAIQDVPSTLDHKRLKSLYEYKSKKTTLTSKSRKYSALDQLPYRLDDSQDGVVTSDKQTYPLKGYSRAVTRAQHSPKLAVSRDPTPNVQTEEYELSMLKESIVGKPLTSTASSLLYSARDRNKSYLDILRENCKNPTHYVKRAPGSSRTMAAATNVSQLKSTPAQPVSSKDTLKPANNEDYIGPMSSQVKGKDNSRREKQKVRFADSRCEFNKDRMVWEISEEDAWCSSVNAMLLRANKVLDEKIKNDHRYPKPDSARVVSPVPPKSPTFLKELLRQDTIDRKQAKGQTKTEKRLKDSVYKDEKHDTGPCRLPASSHSTLSSKANSMKAVQPRKESPHAVAKSSLVYTVPVKEGTQQANLQEKSAGVLKISIQMSKRAQERAWLTHERLKYQRPSVYEYEMPDTRTMPKKLAPLRISKPINFQNPDTRGHERIPMRDIMSKTLTENSGQGQVCFQPRSGVEDSTSSNKSNFLLDQHSETLCYYRDPNMHERIYSIVPLFSDSNNNALLKSATGEINQPVESTCSHDSESKTCRVSTVQDALTFFQEDELLSKTETINESSVVGDERPADENIQQEHTMYTSLNFWQKIDDLSENIKDNSRCFVDCLSSDSILTEGSLLNVNSSEDRLCQVESDKTEKQQTIQKHLPKWQNSFHILNLPPNEEAIKRALPIYISGMHCFQNNVIKSEDNNSMDQEGVSTRMKDNNVKETLLEAIMEYEAETISTDFDKKASSNNEADQLLRVCDNNVDEHRRTAISGSDCGMTCDAIYHNKLTSGYLDKGQTSETPLEPHTRPLKCDKNEHIHNTNMKISQSKYSPDLDVIDMTHYLQEICLEKKTNDTCKACGQHSQHCMPRRSIACRRGLQRVSTSLCYIDNFAVQGSAVALIQKQSVNSFSELKMPCRFRFYPRVFSAVQNRNFPNITKKDNNSRSSLNKPQTNKPSINHVNSIEQTIKQASITSLKVETNSANTYSPKNINKENEKAQIKMNETPSPTKEILTKDSEPELGMYEQVFKDFEDELWSYNNVDGGYFNWEKISVPPSFTKKNWMSSMDNDPETVTWMEVLKAASAHSIYTNSSIAYQQKNEGAADTPEPVDTLEPADKPETADTSERAHRPEPADAPEPADTLEQADTLQICVSPNIMGDTISDIWDSTCDPPNSLCTTTNVKETASSVSTDKDHLSRHAILEVDESSPDLLNTGAATSRPITTPCLCQGDCVPADGSHLVRSFQSMFQSPRAEPENRSRESETSSQMSINFEEDDDNGVLQDKVERSAKLIELKSNKDLHQKNFGPWLNSSLGAKLSKLPTGQARTSKVSTHRMFPTLMNRSFLKTLRNTDILQTFSLDTDRLLKCLQLMTRRTGYLPVFQIKSATCADMKPHVVTINHCAPAYVERRSSSFSGTLHSLPIFFTEDDSGFLTSIYTVTWIPEGVYSLDKAEMEDATVSSSRNVASFGRLLQYSPLASHLAFLSQRAYLIGDEAVSRDMALRTLVACRDETHGDLSKYFTLMCGWVPSHIVSPKRMREEEQSSSSSSVINDRDRKSLRNTPQSQHPDGDFEFSRLPIIRSEIQYSCLDRNTPVTVQDKALSLPQIPCTQSHAIHEGKCWKIPASPPILAETPNSAPVICECSAMNTSPDVKPRVMLCLRCGVTIDCQHTKSESDKHQDNRLPIEKFQTRYNEIPSPKLPKTPEILAPALHHRQVYPQRWDISEMGLAIPLPTPMIVKAPVTEKSPRSKREQQRFSTPDSRSGSSLQRKVKSLTTFPSKNALENPTSNLGPAKSQPFLGKSTISTSKAIHGKVVEQALTSTRQSQKPAKALERECIFKDFKSIHKSTVDISMTTSESHTPAALSGEKNVPQESLPDIKISQKVVKVNPTARSNDIHSRIVPKGAVTCHTTQSTKSLHQKPIKQQLLQTSVSTYHVDKEKARIVEAFVGGWSWNNIRDNTEEEQDLLEKRTWTQPVIPPPFPTNNSVIPPKPAQKPVKNFQLSKAHLAQHKRNLSHISHSYISPYWSKKEVKRARNKTPQSESGDDHSSISRITTNSGMSSTSSESNTEGESSTDESESDSGSSASGSDFFTRYANKGGPTSVDDIFKRTLPKQRLDFNLNRIKEVKENEEREQFGYLRGREGVTPPPRDHGDNIKEVEKVVKFAVSDYDMCSDADEIKELWKLCFPEVDFWETNRRKKFKKRKILF